MTSGNFGDTWTFKADIAFFIFALIFRTSGPKMATFRGKIGEGVGRYWPPTNSFLLLGVCTSVSNLVKIDKEMRPWEWWHTDRQTDRQTQTDFIICPIAICYSYGADNKDDLTWTWLRRIYTVHWCADCGSLLGLLYTIYWVMSYLRLLALSILTCSPNMSFL